MSRLLPLRSLALVFRPAIQVLQVLAPDSRIDQRLYQVWVGIGNCANDIVILWVLLPPRVKKCCLPVSCIGLLSLTT
jgi:hypothetical protein